MYNEWHWKGEVLNVGKIILDKRGTQCMEDDVD